MFRVFLPPETSADEDDACDQIDFDIGDEGGAEIDFDLGEEGVQGLNLEVGDIDWGDIGDNEGRTGRSLFLIKVIFFFFKCFFSSFFQMKSFSNGSHQPILLFYMKMDKEIT